jgi:hypothetical protein
MALHAQPSQEPADCGHHYPEYIGTNDLGEPVHVRNVYVHPEDLTTTLCPHCFDDAMYARVPKMSQDQIAAAFGANGIAK